MDFENILAYNLPKGLPSSVHHHSGGIQQRVVWGRIRKWWEEGIFFPRNSVSSVRQFSGFQSQRQNVSI